MRKQIRQPSWASLVWEELGVQGISTFLRRQRPLWRAGAQGPEWGPLGVVGRPSLSPPGHVAASCPLHAGPEKQGCPSGGRGSTAGVDGKCTHLCNIPEGWCVTSPGLFPTYRDRGEPVGWAGRGPSSEGLTAVAVLLDPQTAALLSWASCRPLCLGYFWCLYQLDSITGTTVRGVPCRGQRTLQCPQTQRESAVGEPWVEDADSIPSKSCN